MPDVTLKIKYFTNIYEPVRGEPEMLINCPKCNTILIIPTPYKTPWNAEAICKNKYCGIIISVSVSFQQGELDDYKRTYPSVSEGDIRKE